LSFPSLRRCDGRQVVREVVRAAVAILVQRIKEKVIPIFPIPSVAWTCEDAALREDLA